MWAKGRSGPERGRSASCEWASGAVGAPLQASLGCSQVAPDPAAQRATVERAVTVWFDSALTKLDTTAVRAGLADDFAILEDSVGGYDRDRFVNLVEFSRALEI